MEVMMLQTNLKDIQNYKHIALYCRCGCTGPESGQVLQAQQDELLRWVKAIGLPAEKVSVYTDNCASFYNKQHGLHKLLESLKDQDAPVLIAALSSDRFCRSFWQMPALAVQAARCGAALYSVRENIDLTKSAIKLAALHRIALMGGVE
jgi:DNA invertase Pin-like site-specific DNA recombinase